MRAAFCFKYRSMQISQTIAQELGVNEQQVNATITLLDEGSSVPFIARYRKEVTGGLDDVKLRTLSERLIYLRELEDWRQAVMAIVEEQGKLTKELRAAFLAADTKTRLEDLYLPFKQKRRTRGNRHRSRYRATSAPVDQGPNPESGSGGIRLYQYSRGI